MEILSVFCGRSQENTEIQQNYVKFLHSRSNPVTERRELSVRLSLIGSTLICVYVCIMCLRCPFACLTKQKKWISCVCQSSSRFTNNNNYFCIVKLHGFPGHQCTRRASDSQQKSTNWNGGSISIKRLASKPPKNVKSTSGKKHRI